MRVNDRKRNIRLGALFAVAVFLGVSLLMQLAYIGNLLWFILYYSGGGAILVMLTASLAYIVKNQSPAKYIGIGLLCGSAAVMAGSAMLSSILPTIDPILIYHPIFDILSAMAFAAYNTAVFIVGHGTYLFAGFGVDWAGYVLLAILLAAIFAGLMKIKLPGETTSGEAELVPLKTNPTGKNIAGAAAANEPGPLSIGIDNEKAIDLSAAFANQEEKINALYGQKEKLLAAMAGKASGENLELLRSAFAACEFSISQVHKTTISTSYSQGVAPITTVHSGGYTSVMGGGTQVYEHTHKNENEYYKLVVRNGSRHNASILMRGRVRNPSNINNYDETLLAARIEAGEGHATTVGVGKAREIRTIEITLQAPSGERKIHIQTADMLSQINDQIGHKVKIKQDERPAGTAFAAMIAKPFKTIILLLIFGYMLLGGLAWCESKGFF